MLMLTYLASQATCTNAEDVVSSTTSLTSCPGTDQTSSTSISMQLIRGTCSNLCKWSRLCHNEHWQWLTHSPETPETLRTGWYNSTWASATGCGWRRPSTRDRVRCHHKRQSSWSGPARRGSATPKVFWSSFLFPYWLAAVVITINQELKLVFAMSSIFSETRSFMAADRTKSYADSGLPSSGFKTFQSLGLCFAMAPLTMRAHTVLRNAAKRQTLPDSSIRVLFTTRR